MLIICLLVCWLDSSFNLHKQLLIYWLSYIKHRSIDIGIFLSVIRKNILENKSWYFPNTGLYFSWNKYYHTARTYTRDACIVNNAYFVRHFSYQIAGKIFRFGTIRFFCSQYLGLSSKKNLSKQNQAVSHSLIPFVIPLINL